MGLFKRGKVFWMSFSHEGKRYQETTGATDRRTAERIFLKVSADLVEGRWFEKDEADRLFEDLLDRYEREILPRKRESTKRGYETIIKTLRAALGEVSLAELTPSKVTAYKAKRYKDRVGPSTINREVMLLKNMLTVAARDFEWIRSNPLAKVRMEKEPPGRTRYLAPDEEEKLLQSSPDWLRQIIVFALNTGLRQGEILSLRSPSVDLFRRVLVVEESKNGEKRTVPLNETVMELLKYRAKVAPISKTDLVFYSPKAGTRIETGNLERAWRAAKTKAKIEDFRFHDLRHTFATRLVQAGVDMYKVQRLLGHKTPAMTQRYAHHSVESLRDGVEVLDLPGVKTATILQQLPKVAAVGVS